MSESALVKVCFKSRPYIGQSTAPANDGTRAKASTTGRAFEDFIVASPSLAAAEARGGLGRRSQSPRVEPDLEGVDDRDAVGEGEILAQHHGRLRLPVDEADHRHAPAPGGGVGVQVQLREVE